MNFYPFHIGDYISHTHHLTDAEDLAYRRMIDLYYLTEKPLPDNYEWIAKRVGSTPEIVITILNEFFGSYGNDDKLWHNKRADVEIAKYQFLKESGKKGAEKRWANRDAMPTQCEPNSPPNATPLATKTNTKNQEPLTKNQIKTPEGVSDSLFKDYLEVRNAKKAKWTETAYKGLQREADKAKMSLSDVMQMCCERGWAGFKAEWVKEEVTRHKQLPLVTNEQIEEAYKIECGKDPKLARFGSYYEMKDYVIKQRELRSRTQA
jgi:uncharacterized protein YdaU (DUF1376 family)